MLLQKYLTHKQIRPLVKEISAGHLLFRQGEMGNSMFLIMDGIVQLFDETEQGQRLVGTYGPGQFFGEKSMLSTTLYQRFFSAQAMTKTIVLEFGLNDVPALQTIIPDFMVSLFQSAAQRLDRAYYMIRVLKSPQAMERLIHCILYFYRCPGLQATLARSIALKIEDIEYLINLDKVQVEQCFNDLVNRKILEKRTDGTYAMRDERALVALLNSVTEAKAA